VDDNHWQTVVAHMASSFREARYEDGLTQALENLSGAGRPFPAH
jgi:uncharacterized membrane protein